MLLVCPHSPRWPTRTRCSSALIVHAGLLLLRVARLTSILLTYVRTCGRNAVLGIGGLHHVRVARLSSFAALAYSYALLVCPHSPCWRTAPTRFSFDLVFADLHSDVWQKRRVRRRWPTSRTCCSFVYIRRAGLLVHVARLPSFSLLANISYRLLVGPHSPRWLTLPTRRSSAFILQAGLLLLRVARLTSFLLTYIRTFGRNTVLGIGGLHLVRVARLPSFSLLANISYRLLVGLHSPRWPTAPTRCSFDLVFADLHSDLWQKCRVWHRCPTPRTCCSFVLIRRAGPLVRIAHPPSFSLLAYLSYAFRICSHSPLPTARKRCSSALILPLFSALAYILYALLVCPYALPYVPCTSRLDLGCWTLYHNVYIYILNKIIVIMCNLRT